MNTRRAAPTGFCACCPSRQSAATGQKIEDLAMATSPASIQWRKCSLPPIPNCARCLSAPPAAPAISCRVVSMLFSSTHQTHAHSRRPRTGARLRRSLFHRKKCRAPRPNPATARPKGQEKFRFLIVGHGGEENWLRERLHRAEFTGVLRGEELARAYANMDLFVFPSHTDTFGNVVLEALASGVPAIVTPDGGPSTIVRDGETGRIAPDDRFASAIAAILANPRSTTRCARPRAPMPSPPVGIRFSRVSMRVRNHPAARQTGWRVAAISGRYSFN